MYRVQAFDSRTEQKGLLGLATEPDTESLYVV